MNILWLAWKDHAHPTRGGAEVVLHELINRQLSEGNNVTLLTSKYPGAKRKERLPNGLQIIRIGSNRILHSVQALAYYLCFLRGKFGLIIETVNTAPYFSLLFRGRAKGLAFYHQLARKVWFFETKAPLNFLGFFLIEPISTWLLSRARTPLVTVSESTKQDLSRFGWSTERTFIISEGIRFEPIKTLNDVQKFDNPTVLSLGALRGMKRTIDQIHAFEIAKQTIPNLQMKIAGDATGKYGEQVLAAINQSSCRKDIEFFGRVDEEQKKLLMQKSHLITVTSIKEGWGLIVTEAASQGTPAIVYDTDGLRDSVRNHETGLVVSPGPERLAAATVFSLRDKKRYQSMRRAAWEWSKLITFDKSYRDLKQAMEEA